MVTDLVPERVFAWGGQAVVPETMSLVTERAQFHEAHKSSALARSRQSKRFERPAETAFPVRIAGASRPSMKSVSLPGMLAFLVGSQNSVSSGDTGNWKPLHEG